MTVLHLLGSPGDGGAETYFLSLARALAEDGLSQAAALHANAGREAAMAALGVPAFVLPYDAPFDFVSGRRIRESVEYDFWIGEKLDVGIHIHRGVNVRSRGRNSQRNQKKESGQALNNLQSRNPTDIVYDHLQGCARARFRLCVRRAHRLPMITNPSEKICYRSNNSFCDH